MRSLFYLPLVAFVVSFPFSVVALPIGSPSHDKKCLDPVLSSVTDLPSKINVNTNPDDPVNAGIKVTSGSDPNSKPDNLNLGAGVGLCLDIGGTGCGHSSSTPTPTPSHVSSSPLTPTPTGPWCNTAGCNENDIWVWLNDLNAKILVCLDLLDGKNDPQDPVSKIIAEVNAAIALLVNIKVDLTHNHGGKCDDIIKLLVDLLVKIVLAVSKYSLAIIFNLLKQLDVSIYNLLVALDPYIHDIAGLCGKSLLNLSLFVKLGLRLTLGICGLL